MSKNRINLIALTLTHTLLLAAAAQAAPGSAAKPAPPPKRVPGILQFEATSLAVDENSGTASFVVTRTGGSEGLVSVAVASRDGSATAPLDYAPLSTTVAFGAGDTTPKVVTVQIANDTAAELPETFAVSLSAPTGGATLGPNTEAGVSIRDNDPIALQVSGEIQQLVFSWPAVAGATHYRLLQNPDGASGFTQIGADHPADVTSAQLAISAHQHNWLQALYRLEACNALGCAASNGTSAAPAMLQTIGYFKASNTQTNDIFGRSTAVSADGLTLAVGAPFEAGTSRGINGDQNIRAHITAAIGAVYVFARASISAPWSQQAYVKASNADIDDRFGTSVSLSADGSTLAVGANFESSSARGVDNALNDFDNLNQGDNSATNAGAVYVFRRSGTTWSQQAYVKASNTDPFDSFGASVALSHSGDALVVGASEEDGAGVGAGANGADNSAPSAGAAYVFTRSGFPERWLQQIYLKASNTEPFDRFGQAVAMSGDGLRLAVGAFGEDSASAAVNGTQSDNSATDAGAVYTYSRAQFTNWSFDNYVKASNTQERDRFGRALALNADGTVLAVGVNSEDSAATGVNSDQSNNGAPDSGAAYVFTRSGISIPWSLQAYIKASNTDAADLFGSSVALSGGGDVLAIGAPGESSAAVGVAGNATDNSVPDAGAAYVFRRDPNTQTWSQQAYVKASNTGGAFGFGDGFGGSLGLSADANTLAVGAPSEDSAATGIDGNQNDDTAGSSGAVYVY